MSYQETIQFLYAQLPFFQREGKSAYKANLDNTIALDNYFNRPHLKFKSIHIAGTNGKGSCSHILAAVLQTAGYKTGLYTSPHLKDFRERIKINGQEIPEQAVVDFVARHHSIITNLRPSFFELSSAMAFDWFACEQIDVAVIEVGMGGRLDSTNIIAPQLCVITNIGLDHTEFLGNSLAQIAGEKAGIIKVKTPVVIGGFHADTAPVFIEKATENEAPIYFADQYLQVQNSGTDGLRQNMSLKVKSHDKSCNTALTCLPLNFGDSDTIQVSVDLLGNYQQYNICTVLTALAVIRQNKLFIIDNEDIYKALPQASKLTGLKGRWQQIGENPTVICDTGHNAHGLQQVLPQLETLAKKHDKLFIVLGMVNDKDLSNILCLFPQNAYYFFTQAQIPRAMDAHKLAALCADAGLKGEIIVPVKKTLEKARQLAGANDLVFVGGSTFVVAEVI